MMSGAVPRYSPNFFFFNNVLIITFVWPPQPLHAVPLERHPGELDEALADVEVDERRDLEEAHGVLLGVLHGLRLVDLPLELKVEAVADQHLRDAGSVLKEEQFNLTFQWDIAMKYAAHTLEFTTLLIAVAF